MQKLLTDEKDFADYEAISKKETLDAIRCNTLKISPEKLKKRLEEKGWRISQPWKSYLEVMIIEGKIENGNLVPLGPGELGRALEHMLGFYYVQELSSMLPIIALDPKEGESFLDLCAAPGSKTTQAAAFMKNSGILIANEISIGRLKILASNLERCGVTNTIITKKEGVALCRRFNSINYKFDKILLDAPCSGEGTLRSSPKTYIMWNINAVKQLANIQKKLFEESFSLLKVGGELVYSTCTHSPEEDEGVVNFALEKFKGKIKIEKIFLPIKTRQGITEWGEEKYSKEVKEVCRVYPQDNNTEGFFVSKFRRIAE